MNINFYSNISENNAINKIITPIASSNAVLKGNVSYETPVLVLLYDVNKAKKSNYVYIPEYDRYYFINDIIDLTGGRIEIHLSVDVLMSFKKYILALPCVIDKQVSIGNKYYNDGSWGVTSKEFIQSYNFPNGFNENGEFILIACGG